MRNTREFAARIVGTPVWSDSGDVCALSDDERHLGHIILAKGWHALDATKLNDAGDSYRYIGGFREKREAKSALERSVLRSERPMVMTAQ